jgi:biopolymer transport protein TolR
MSRRQRTNKPMAEINVVPYIDVMLVLLIIFMVTAPLLVRNVDVDLPVTRGSASQVAEDLPPVLVGVDADNRYFIFDDESGERDYEVTEAGAIADAVAATLAEPGREVMVYGDARVEYDRVLRLLQALQDTLQRQGVEGKTVRLMTMTGEEE